MNTGTIEAVMIKTAQRIAARLRESASVHIVTHIDADGITAGSIASAALTRAGVEHDIEFLKQLDEEKLQELKGAQRRGDTGIVWFTDFGSGLIHRMNDLEAVITDHHVPAQVLPPREKRGDITAFLGPETAAPGNSENVLHLNPHLFGKNGADDISGAGVTYMVARAMDDRNMKLAALAVVGAVGDLQDAAHGKLGGTNRHIVEDATRAAVLDAVTDIRSFGRETRPVHKLLQYTNDPIIPGITGDPDACMEFLVGCEVKLREGSNSGAQRWRHWVDLSHAERKRVISGLVKHCLSRGVGAEATRRLIGEVYVLSGEPRHEPLRDAKEFATMLNACGRYGKGEIGYRVCLGDREDWYDKAILMLRNHRQVLVDMIQHVEENGVTKLDNIQYFDGGDYIPENVVWIVAGMILGAGELDTGLPLLGFANAGEGTVKVSGRTVRRLVRKGVNLSRALHEGSIAFGGAGGGHNIAAGAHIPAENKEEFLALMDEIVGRQLGRDEKRKKGPAGM